MSRLSLYPGIEKSLLIFFAILVSMTSVVIMSGVYKSNASSENALMTREMRSWSKKIDEANRNNLILVQHEDTFKTLVDRSVIGDENRLSWVEVVQKITDSRKMSSVKYNIASQVLLDKDKLDSKYKNIDVFKSVMSLDMKILHEGDLFVMLDALRREAKGLLNIDRCDIELVDKKINDGIVTAETKDSMRAHCEISWYTLKQAQKS